LQTDRQTDRQTERERERERERVKGTDMTRLLVAFLNFAKTTEFRKRTVTFVILAIDWQILA